MEKFDFSGWATRNDLKCSDGRTIRRDAFKDCDGKTVPLVWNHNHNDPNNILGHALLKNRPEGVYAYGKFNDSESGKVAKLLVDHGDISSLSIMANQLKQNGGDVLHGVIREVSLVLAGANPGAFIDTVVAHSDDSDETAIIFTGEFLEFEHGEDLEEEGTKVAEEEIKEEKVEEEITHADEDSKTDDSAETVADVFNTLTDKQKQVVYALIGEALTSADGEDDTTDETTTEEESEVKHNVFDKDTEIREDENVLSHEAQMEIIGDAKRYGSMKESALAHGIDDVEWLFPDYKELNNPPTFIQRDMAWVSKVMNAARHSPFSRIKTTFADITEDEARARGYIKGKMKKEEFFSLLKRTTDPQTIYKKQKMDRDDVIDITSFDVISWLKSEMRMMLNEEIARAILVGDGRLASDDDKIQENHIRPIWKDEDLYTIKARVTPTGTGSAGAVTEDDKAKAFIRAAIKARKDYKGSGSPVLFTTEDMLTDMLLLTDEMGRDLYTSEAQLATKLRVREIITVPVMENLSRTSGSDDLALMGIIVNMTDYNIGADRGGAVSMFEDFDIDYNQQKYLIETRCSGALIKPYSAIALEIKTN